MIFPSITGSKSIRYPSLRSAKKLASAFLALILSLQALPAFYLVKAEDEAFEWAFGRDESYYTYKENNSSVMYDDSNIIIAANDVDVALGIGESDNDALEIPISITDDTVVLRREEWEKANFVVQNKQTYCCHLIKDSYEVKYKFTDAKAFYNSASGKYIGLPEMNKEPDYSLDGTYLSDGFDFNYDTPYYINGGTQVKFDFLNISNYLKLGDYADDWYAMTRDIHFVDGEFVVHSEKTSIGTDNYHAGFYGLRHFILDSSQIGDEYYLGYSGESDFYVNADFTQKQIEDEILSSSSVLRSDTQSVDGAFDISSDVEFEFTKTDCGYNVSLLYHENVFKTVTVNKKYAVSIDLINTCGSVFKGANKNDLTGAQALVEYIDGSRETVKITAGMLSKSGILADTAKEGTLTNLDLTYAGLTLNSCFTLNICDLEDYCADWIEGEAVTGYEYELETGEIDENAQYIMVAQSSPQAFDFSSVQQNSTEFGKADAFTVNLSENEESLYLASAYKDRLTFKFSSAGSHTGVGQVTAVDENEKEITGKSTFFPLFGTASLIVNSESSQDAFKAMTASTLTSADGFAISKSSENDGLFELTNYSDTICFNLDNTCSLAANNIFFDESAGKWSVESEKSAPVSSQELGEVTYSYINTKELTSGKSYVITNSYLKAEVSCPINDNGSISSITVANTKASGDAAAYLDPSVDYSAALWTANETQDGWQFFNNGYYLSYVDGLTLTTDNPVSLSYIVKNNYLRTKIDTKYRYLQIGSVSNVWNLLPAQSTVFFYEQVADESEEPSIQMQFENNNHKYVRLYKLKEECEIPSGSYALLGACDKIVDALPDETEAINDAKSLVTVLFSQENETKGALDVTNGCEYSANILRGSVRVDITRNNTFIGSVRFILSEIEMAKSEPVIGDAGFVDCKLTAQQSANGYDLIIEVTGTGDENGIICENAALYDVISPEFSIVTASLPENVIANTSLRVKRVDTDSDNVADFTLEPNSFVWLLGQVTQDGASATVSLNIDEEISQAVSLSEKCRLTYMDLNSQAVTKKVSSPVCSVSGLVNTTVFYLVNENGQPLNSNTKGTVTDIENAYVVLGPINDDNIDKASCLPSAMTLYSNDETVLNSVTYIPVVATDGSRNDTVVIDYGLPVNITVLSNDIYSCNCALNGICEYSSDISFSSCYDLPAIQTENYLDLEYGSAQISGNSVVFTADTGKFYEPQKFIYEVKTTNGYYYSSVTVIPASELYFEESFFTLEGDWEQLGESENAFQAQDIPGFTLSESIDANNAYGSDEAYDNPDAITYSLNTAVKATVSKLNPKGPKATFEFTGSRFDLFCSTSSLTGFAYVKVYKDGEICKNYSVDTFYAPQDSTDTQTELYQIPVISSDTLEWGTYTVSVEPFYVSFFDNENAGEYSLILDGIKIYNPCGDCDSLESDVSSAYKQDLEYNASYKKIRDELLSADEAFDFSASPSVIIGDEDYAAGGLFISSQSALSMEDFEAFKENYKLCGPNNEVYLAKGQAIAFYITASTFDKPDNLSIGIKSAGGTQAHGSIVVTNSNREKPITIGVKGATCQFKSIRKVVSWVQTDTGLITEYPIIIYNNSEALISLTDLRWSYGEKEETPVLSMVSSKNLKTIAAAKLNLLELSENGANPQIEAESTPSGGKIISFSQFIKLVLSYIKTIIVRIFKRKY